jgi:hypothetical protein
MEASQVKFLSLEEQKHALCYEANQLPGGRRAQPKSENPALLQGITSQVICPPLGEQSEWTVGQWLRVYLGKCLLLEMKSEKDILF